MAFSRQSYSTVDSSGNSVQFPSFNTTAGWLHLLAVRRGNPTDDTSISDNCSPASTYTKDKSQVSAGDHAAYIASAVAAQTKTGCIVTITGTGGYSLRGVLVWYSTGAAVSVDKTASTTNSSTTSFLTGQTATTTENVELVFAACTLNTEDGVSGVSSGFGNLVIVPSPSAKVATADQITSSTGQYQATFTITGAQSGTGLIATYKEAAAGHTVSVAQVTETDLAQTIGRLKYKAVGQTTESDTVQVVTPRRIRAIGQPAESDLAQTFTKAKVKALVQATESDLSQALTQRRTYTLGQPTEADLAQTVAPSFAHVVSQVTESDTALSPTHAKAKAIAQCTESETSQAVNRLKLKALGQAVETTLAQALGKLKARLLGQPTETDFAQGVFTGDVIPVGQVTETDLAQAITWNPKRRLINMVTESDMAFAVTRLGAVAVRFTRAVTRAVVRNVTRATHTLRAFWDE